MTQGELEKIPAKFEKIMRQLEIRIMEDMVRRIKENGFSTASADWQFTRLKQLGLSEEQIKKWVKEALQATDKEIEKIYSDETYQEYMKQARGYEVYGKEQIPFEENVELQQLIEAVKQQTAEEFQNITGSMGFVKKAYHGAQQVLPLNEFYQTTLDNAVMDIHSGAFDYSTVIGRTINDMTRSGLRWIDYESGWHNRVPVAARRAVMTGFRQVQGKINEQVARDLHTDSYEVTVHIGARPTHQVWEGRVWTMEQLKTVCGLGTGPGLHGWNCYHDYNAFIPGVSVRTYTDEQLQQIHDEENEKKEYLGKEYTTYEALQRQRQLETRARKYREDVHLLEESIKDVPDDQATLLDDEIEAKKSRYLGTLQEYKDFSKKMGLPMQKERIYQDGLKVKMEPKPQDNGLDKELIVQTGGKETGGHSYVLGEYATEREKLAAKEYSRICKEYDADRISKSSGIPIKDVEQIKRHLFYEKHKLYEGYGYLAPDYDIAVAWKRLKEGCPEHRDIVLLKHERLESYYEKKYNLSISEAHKRAKKIFDWEKELLDVLGEGGEPDGLL